MTYRSRTTLGLVSGTALLLATPASADFIGVVGSNSIDGSLCVGFDCVANESFGFDTIRMKENNLRLHFDDTSTAASFPPNDWRLYANDSANGGSSYFGIEDATAGRFVFRVFAGARSNALTVDSQGDLGLGTTTPATDIDIKIGDTPTVRLQQDGTSGFTPQTWDVAGNETSFFIRDATGGSTLPFRILSGGAPSQSLVIDDDGDIGIGAGTSPDADLHIQRTGTQVLVQYETTGTASVWNLVMDADGTPNEGISFTRAGTGVRELRLQPNGDMAITGTLTTGGGTCGGGCDAVFTEEYDLPSIAEHTEQMYALGYLPNVGPTIENQPINVSDKLGRMLNELEHAHIYIAQQHDTINDLTNRLTVLEQTLQD